MATFDHPPPDIVQRMEHAECEAYLDIFEACPEEARVDLGVAGRRLGHGVHLQCRALDANVLNRVSSFGDGLAPSAFDQVIRGFTSSFGACGSRSWMVSVKPGAVDAEAALARSGFVRHPRNWAKFLLDTHRPPYARTDLEIRELGDGDGRVFGETAGAAFGMPSAAAWLGNIVGRPHWRVFAAFDQGEVVAAGALWIKGRDAWLGIGGTRTSHRRRGGQSALLARRVAAAREAGCTMITTETGVPHPGEAGPSFDNIQRAGFRIAYVRPNFHRPAAAA
jgi:hypothetical protein